VLFTLAMLAIYRLAGIFHAGVNFVKLEEFFNQHQGSLLGFVDCSPAATYGVDDFCPGDHAVHYGIDHPAAFDGGV